MSLSKTFLAATTDISMVNVTFYKITIRIFPLYWTILIVFLNDIHQAYR